MLYLEDKIEFDYSKANSFEKNFGNCYFMPDKFCFTLNKRAESICFKFIVTALSYKFRTFLILLLKQAVALIKKHCYEVPLMYP